MLVPDIVSMAVGISLDAGIDVPVDASARLSFGLTLDLAWVVAQGTGRINSRQFYTGASFDL